MNGEKKNELGQIVIFNTDEGDVRVQVDTVNETIWLNQKGIAELFDVKVPNVSYHLKNIFNEGELCQSTVIKEILITAQSGARGISEEKVRFYNLDVIIAVGYRVNSKRATAFRIWANKVLKEYLVTGYAINNRIAEQKYEELSQLVRLLGRTVRGQEKLSGDESKELVNVVSDYTYALDTLDKYDYQSLTIDNTTYYELFHATYDNAIEAIKVLKEKFGGGELFGNEKDQSFKSSIGQIYQTFDGEDLYPSVEEKAAMLLYLVTKNHSFSDGNKRIAATLFLWFLQNNGILYNPDGSKRISDGTLVALTLMIAESNPDEKDIMIRIVVNLINKRNV